MPNQKRYFTTFLVSLALAWVSPSWAANFVVNCQNGPEPLIEAIETANLTPAHDRILVRGQCVLSTGYANLDSLGDVLLPSVTSPITIRGIGETPATIEGDTSGTLLHVAPAGTLRVSRVVFRNGIKKFADNGGGAMINEGELFAHDVSFLDNRAFNGGALYNRGPAHLVEVTFRGNYAVFYGGAISSTPNLHVERSTFEDNEADNGGAISGSGVIEDTLFSNNIAEDGGAIFSGGQLTVARSLFLENGSSVAGAIYARGPVEIVESQFLRNRASEFGVSALSAEFGGVVRNTTFAENVSQVYLFNPPRASVLFGKDLLIDGCSFTHNRVTAEYTYGALVEGENLTITNSTIAENDAGHMVPTVSLTHGSMSYSTIWNNRGELPAVYVNNTLMRGNIIGNDFGETVCDPNTYFETRGYNLLSDSSCLIFDAPGDMVDTDPQLGPLDDHGGPTSTLLPARTSPAVDAIPARECLTFGGIPVGVDQRDVLRPQGERCDIGAVELWKPGRR